MKLWLVDVALSLTRNSLDSAPPAGCPQRWANSTYCQLPALLSLPPLCTRLATLVVNQHFAIILLHAPLIMNIISYCSLILCWVLPGALKIYDCATSSLPSPLSLPLSLSPFLPLQAVVTPNLTCIIVGAANT